MVISDKYGLNGGWMSEVAKGCHENALWKTIRGELADFSKQAVSCKWVHRQKT